MSTVVQWWRAFAAVIIGYDSAFIVGSITFTPSKNEFNWKQYFQAESDLIGANIVVYLPEGPPNLL